MSSLFKSKSGQREILELYDQKLAELNLTYESVYIDTSFGRTHILVTGDSSNPALVLVHGSNGCAPIALDCYPSLSSTHQVFAIDVLGQPNKSDGVVLSMKDDSYGKWVMELIEKLELNDVVMAGFSFGGLIILKTLAYNAERIKEVFLASPAFIVNGNPLKALFKVFIPMKRYMRTHKMKYLEKFLSEVFTNRDEFAVSFLSKVFLHFNMDFGAIPVISKKEASKINTPITLLCAKKDVIFPGVKMMKRAKNLLPLKHTVLLEDSKHVQDEEGNAVFEGLIMK